MDFAEEDYTIIINDFDYFDLLANAVVASRLAFQRIVGIWWLDIQWEPLES